MATFGADVIRRMAAGDREAFGRFYDRDGAFLYALVLRLVRDPVLAADVLQDVFWQAWQAASTYDARRGSPEAWLVIRARARAIERIRDRGEPDGRLVARDESAGRDAPIGGALARLPEAERAVIELAYYAGLTQTEIAARLAEPIERVQTRIRAGLEQLRGIVKDDR